MCYVGKATKIFIVIVSMLAIAGLVLAFHFVRHGASHKVHQPLGCPSASGVFCSPPFYPQPIPAATTGAGPPFSAPGTPFLGSGGDGNGGGSRLAAVLDLCMFDPRTPRPFVQLCRR